MNAKTLLTAARRPAKLVYKTAKSIGRALKAAAIAHEIFGGRKLTHAAKLYIVDAQTYYGTLVVESALDGRDLFEPECELPASDYFEKLDTATWSLS